MDYKNIEERMNKTISVYEEKLSEVRAGRANPAILNKVKIDYYGTPTPINQVAGVSVPEARLIVIQPWDVSVLKDIEKNSKTYTIKIPEGIRDGEKIRLIGQGKPGKNGGKPGDLLIKINIESDNNFRLQGSDIYTDLCLSPWEAALGTRTFVKTIDDETKIYIPQGIETGEKVRIPNKGYKINKETRGDLVAEIKIVNPKQLTKEEKEIYKRLSEISKFNPRTDKE